MNRKKLLEHLVLLMFFIFIMNSLALQFYWYYSIWYFDIIMHFLSGFWVSLFFIYVFYVRKQIFTRLFPIFLFVLLIGISWELYEFYIYQYISQIPFDILDTTSDIFFDLSGGLCAILYLLVPLENQRTGSKE
ncbi:hypothetical protein A3A05_03725 [Candidatus Nomurabacteria bacterium RIFCSPLOWO2_01_FULL_41_12]|uniref:VanZ-like domain-containing protein n=1 Tax=Candidatus Nomurabacteria bacterium RIFCSPLOWO2_01_FULL_41_12 TaxID=1801774 RepID=A0A1F6WUG7_9BACT|nr:MAG: hypothetical protein A3A05_03725 [Candidatus Nomurabacteria bacterium RIFCSPLOWO2_01_FULL_41_12]